MDRRRFLLGSAGLAGFLSAGCPRNSEPPSAANAPPAPPADGGKTVFAIIPKMLNNPVFTLAQRGAEKAAREIGGITVEYNGSPTGVATEQADLLRRYTQRRVAGIAISVVDAAAVRPAIDAAAGAGIAVICFDSDCPNSQRRTFFSVDNRRVGEALVMRLAEAAGGPARLSGTIAILSGQASAPNLQQRVAAAAAVLKKYPGVRVLPTLFCDDQERLAVDKIRATMAENADLRGWIMVGGWPLFVPHALDSITDFERTKVVAVDALPVEVDYVQRGQVACLLAQRCFGWGEESIRILHRLQTEPGWRPPPFIDAGYDMVLKSPTPLQRERGAAEHARVFSVVEYQKQWDEWNKAA